MNDIDEEFKKLISDNDGPDVPSELKKNVFNIKSKLYEYDEGNKDIKKIQQLLPSLFQCCESLALSYILDAEQLISNGLNFQNAVVI